MKKVISIALLIFSASLSAETIDNSVTVHNMSEKTKQIWVSGEEFNIRKDSSLIVPCYPGESVYVQSIENTNLILCGTTKEINNEY